MPQFGASNAFLIVSVLVFIAVLLALEALYLVWKSHLGANARRLGRRLDALAGEAGRSTAKLKKPLESEAAQRMGALLRRFPGAGSLQEAIHQAGLAWSTSNVLLSCASGFAVGYLAITILARQDSLLGLIAGACLALLPLLFVFRKRARRLRKIEQQLPEALDIMVRGLKAGHAFSSALQMLAEEMNEPIAGEFRLAHEEISYGVALQIALVNLSRRVPVTDLRYFVVSVLIQRESGGNLTEVLSNLSRLIRERLKLLSKVRVLSTEGRMSAWILGLMPFFMAALMNFMNPEFMSLLWNDPLGITMIKTLLTMMAIGALVLIRIIRIRV